MGAAGIGEFRAYAGVLTVAEKSRLAVLNDRSLFLNTSTVYDAAKGAAAHRNGVVPAAWTPPTGDEGVTGGLVLVNDWTGRPGQPEFLASRACTRQ